jgi:hypothetical protein
MSITFYNVQTTYHLSLVKTELVSIASFQIVTCTRWDNHHIGHKDQAPNTNICIVIYPYVEVRLSMPLPRVIVHVIF